MSLQRLTRIPTEIIDLDSLRCKFIKKRRSRMDFTTFSKRVTLLFPLGEGSGGRGAEVTIREAMGGEWGGACSRLNLTSMEDVVGAEGGTGLTLASEKMMTRVRVKEVGRALPSNPWILGKIPRTSNNRILANMTMILKRKRRTLCSLARTQAKVSSSMH
jgi:hypothetical protein